VRDHPLRFIFGTEHATELSPAHRHR
jgi:hypothetical protein